MSPMDVAVSPARYAHPFVRGVWLAAALLSVACGGGETTASKSAAAYDHKPGAVEGGHSHGGHAATPVGASSPSAPTGDTGGHAGHAAAGSGSHGMPGGGAHPPRPEASAHEGHAAGGVAAAAKARPAEHAAHVTHAGTQSAASDPHAGHAAIGTAPSPAPAMGTAKAHAGHAASAGPATRAAQPSAGVPPGEPAAVLKSDPLDAPAPTSVEDAARAAAMASEMAGGAHHMSHGSYSHLDAGRPSPRPTPSPKENEQ